MASQPAAATTQPATPSSAAIRQRRLGVSSPSTNRYVAAGPIQISWWQAGHFDGFPARFLARAGRFRQKPQRDSKDMSGYLPEKGGAKDADFAFSRHSMQRTFPGISAGPGP